MGTEMYLECAACGLEASAAALPDEWCVVDVRTDHTSLYNTPACSPACAAVVAVRQAENLRLLVRRHAAAMAH